jgi:hypothetical protein
MDDNRTYAGLFMLLILFGSFWAGTQLPNSPLYSGGWEVRTSIYEVRQNQIDYGASTGEYPWKVEYWGSSSVRYDTDASSPYELGAGYTSWDWDVTGCADTQIDITNPAHVTFDTLSQEWVPATDDEVFYQYSKTVTYIGDNGQEVTEVYFWDHHVYTFWITVIADPDVHHDGAFSVVEAKPHSLNAAGHGAVASIAPKILFEVKGWDVGPSSFTLPNDDGSVSTYNALTSTFWTGIMSASVMESYAGYVQKSRLDDGDLDTTNWDDAPTAETGIHASATMSGALNMYYVDNPTAEVDEWTDSDAQDNHDAIQGVPQEVLIEFYGELQPGFSWPLLGTISTSAVMYQYRARVDVLITGGYQLASGQQPDEPVDPKIIDTGADPIGALLDILNGLFGGANIIILVLIVIVFIYIAYRIIRWMYGGGD